MEEILRDNTVLVEEKRTLKFEINTLKKFVYEKQREMADLHREIGRYISAGICRAQYYVEVSDICDSMV